MSPKQQFGLACLFGALALLLLPITCLWALFAYLAGNKYPLIAMRGKNFDEALDTPDEV